MGPGSDRTSPEKLASADRRREFPTKAEACMRDALRRAGIDEPFQREVPMYGYCADFFWQRLALTVEIDGGHHDDRTEYDERRDVHLAAHGLRTLRFENEAVLGGAAAVARAIYSALLEQARVLKCPAPSVRPTRESRYLPPPDDRSRPDDVPRPSRRHQRKVFAGEVRISERVEFRCGCTGRRVSHRAIRIAFAVSEPCGEHRATAARAVSAREHVRSLSPSVNTLGGGRLVPKVGRRTERWEGLNSAQRKAIRNVDKMVAKKRWKYVGRDGRVRWMNL